MPLNSTYGTNKYGRTTTVPCNWCNKPVPIFKSQIRTHTFCKDNNKACYKAWLGQLMKGNIYNQYKKSADYFITNCEWCNKEIKKELYRKKSYTHFFCGDSCRAKWIGKHNTGQNNPAYVERIKTIYIKCGKPIELLPCRYKHIRTCNNCRGKYAKKSLAEIQFEELCSTHNIPITYCGDGSFKIGHLKPDFIHSQSKTVIEVFGEIYHSPLLMSIKRRKLKKTATYDYRNTYYKKHNWKMIVFWSHEIQNVTYVLSTLEKHGIYNGITATLNIPLTHTYTRKYKWKTISKTESSLYSCSFR